MSKPIKSAYEKALEAQHKILKIEDMETKKRLNKIIVAHLKELENR